jgi:hypothetical protein
MSIEISNTLDYKQTQVSHSEYKLAKLLQQSGGETVTITGAQQVSIFEIPAVGFNLSKSQLRFTATPAASGAGRFNYLSRDVLPIDRMELYTRAGVYLCDISNFSQFTKSAMKSETDLKTHLTKSSQDFMKPCDALGSAIEGKRPNNTPVSKVYSEPQYVEVGAVNAAQPVQQRIITLGDIKNTIFSVNKSLHMGNEVLLLRITWAPYTSWGWHGDSATDPTGDATALANNIALTNVSMYLSQEMNPMVLAGLQSQISQSGMTVSFPFCHSYKTNLTGTSHAVSLRFSRGHGKKLQKVIHAVYPNAETVNNRFNTTNAAATRKITRYYTLLNNRRVQEFDLEANSTDYMTLKEYLHDSVVQNQNVFDFNWAHVENWTGGEKNLSDAGKQSGLDLSTEQKYDLYLTTTGALNHYDFAITTKDLMVSASGVQVM